MSAPAACRILAIPGDGIGSSVVSVAASLLGRLLPGASVEVAPAGYDVWCEQGESLPAATLERARQAHGVLFGCTSTPSPPPPGYESPILRLRRELGARINVRYCAAPGRLLDVVMVRDCEEGLYSGRERPTEGGWIAEYRITEEGTRAASLAASRIARGRSGRVTVVHKANVLRHSDGSFRRVAIETLEAEGIEWREELADAAGYHLVLDPARYDVMLMTGHVGDILSDVAAAVVGGLGLVPSIGFGGRTPLAEPVHGSAPDLAGSERADPVAAVLSAVLLLEHIGQEAAARALRAAVWSHLEARRGDAAPLTTRAVAVDLERRLAAPHVTEVAR